MRHLLRIVLWSASVGWLIPAYHAAFFLFGALRYDPASNSFPFLAASQEMFVIAFSWFARVVMAWTAYAAIVVTRRRPRPTLPQTPTPDVGYPIA